ncbi:LuxR C-terminal-related transcriptional regulator [Streptomyces lydicus]|nr:LuxR C-terminal-related transcriptional regulator [Streptomyces lydicus]
MTAPAPTTPLTPAERRIAQHVVNGLQTRQIAVAETVSAHTVRSHMITVRRKLHCPERCSLAVVAHRLLRAREVSVPAAKAPSPDLSTEQMSLLRAVTRHSRLLDIAHAAVIDPGDLRATLDKLLADTDAPDTTRLVTRAHAWNLLTAKQDGANS